MTLQLFFTEQEIELMNIALEHQQKRWQAIAKKPIQGYGKASELAKKKKAEEKAEEFQNLLVKIMNYTI
ncbi:MAG: hypothetical protein LC109_03375 [Bacteroidia bacterium]|nr:hypothetical protein [Bacteroidia bacterium]